MSSLPDNSVGSSLAHHQMLFPFDGLSEPEVKRYLRHFGGPERPFLRGSFRRSEDFLVGVENILMEEGLPAELSALAIVESGFKVRAKSHAGAYGIWQFMPATAREYGLRVNWFVDERKDIYKSTRAAARLLRRLYRRYGDWYLAWSAYNAGPGNVNKAIRRGRSKDFFYLSRRKLLPKETRNYVPKIIAVAHIRRNLHRYRIL